MAAVMGKNSNFISDLGRLITSAEVVKLRESLNTLNERL
jgi:hypothetical protein